MHGVKHIRIPTGPVRKPTQNGKEQILRYAGQLIRVVKLIGVLKLQAYFDFALVYANWRVKANHDRIWHAVERYQWEYLNLNSKNWTYCGQYLQNPDFVDTGSAYYDPKTKGIPEPMCQPCMKGLLEAKRDKALRETEHWIRELEKL